MKTPPITFVKIFILSLFIIAPLISCTQEDLLANIIEEKTSGEDPDPDPDSDSDSDPVEGLEISTTPCDYNLSTVKENETLEIECQLDLKGKTVILPAGVTLNYKGGEIINGILKFSSAGKIDGKLLNHKLTVDGNVSLVSEIFVLYPSRWQLVQGKTTSKIAQENNNNLEDLMFYTKSIGATTFTIDKFDAYFEVSKVTSTTTNRNFYPQKEGINIPSDFTLQMTDNTIMRVFPTSGKLSGSLFGIDGISNSTIRGGVLYGDRDLRQYSKDNAEEGAHLLTIRSGKNIILDGIKFKMGSRGAVTINSYGFSFNPDYDPTNNITIRNCLFEKNRAMSLSITDGYDIVVDNNTFIDSSQPTAKSDGGVVGYAINMEPVRKRDQVTGELVHYQKVYDIVIKNNTETGSRQGAITIFSGDNIIIENNNIENVISYTFASNSKIRNNNFVASAERKKPAIISGGSGETVFNNEISGNTITGYSVGISANHKLVDIFNNTINDCVTGIQLKESTDMKIYGNVITNTKSFSRGIMAHIANVNNVKVYDNKINVFTNALYFVQLNKETYANAYSVDVYDNEIISGVPVFSNSKGVVFSENDLSVGLQLYNSYEIEIKGNAIVSEKSHGISLLGKNYDVYINNNKINYPTTGNFECIKIASTTSKNEINLANNTCN